MEKRFKLSKKQQEALTSAQQQITEARTALDTAVAHANTVGTLLADFLGLELTALAASRLDPNTEELVVTLTDPAEAKPTKAVEVAVPDSK